MPDPPADDGDLLDALLASGATAAFCVELADAVRLERAAKARGLGLPADLSVVALGSHIRTEGSGTRFASFAIPREEMGRQATAMLVRRVEGGMAQAVQQVLLPCEPIRGETLGPAKRVTEPTNRNDDSMREMKTDILVVGGGLGGVAAALGALEAGRTVVMSEEYDWIGGQLTSQAVPPDEHSWVEQFGVTRRYRALRNGIRRYYRDHYPLTAASRAWDELNPGAGWVSRLCAEPQRRHQRRAAQPRAGEALRFRRCATRRRHVAAVRRRDSQRHGAMEDHRSASEHQAQLNAPAAMNERRA